MAREPLAHTRPVRWSDLKAILQRYQDSISTTKDEYRADVLALGRMLDHLLNLLHEHLGYGAHVCREQLLFLLCRRCADYTDQRTNFLINRINRRHREGRCTCYDGDPTLRVAVPTDPRTNRPERPQVPQHGDVDGDEIE